ncbi:MAG: DapH/DapD/GlmU-related protein [Hyphomicrobiales bacterium]|nr:DapH/DapD/GlmU-related protein [Hyphomicrobiales bacterium]
MSVAAAIFRNANYELASRPVSDYILETASRVTDELPVVLEDVCALTQWRAFLGASKASHILLLEASRPFLQVETLKAFLSADKKEQAFSVLISGEDFHAAALIDKNILYKAETDSVSFKGLIELAIRETGSVDGRECDSQEAFAIETSAQLAQAEAMMQKRLRERALQAGACLQDPDSVTFSFDTVLEPGVIVEPNVVFAPGVRVAQGARIRAFSYLEGANIEAFAIIGPYARVRPGTNIGARARIGNFVEVKQANIEEDAKVNHLSYVGDANVGKRANIGAGTITCNFDGKEKHKTNIGDDAFIGSNTSLVAPVRVGKGATVGAGSTITDDVGDETLAIARARQSSKPGKKDKGN